MPLNPFEGPSGPKRTPGGVAAHQEASLQDHLQELGLVGISYRPLAPPSRSPLFNDDEEEPSAIAPTSGNFEDRLSFLRRHPIDLCDRLVHERMLRRSSANKTPPQAVAVLPNCGAVAVFCYDGLYTFDLGHTPSVGESQDGRPLRPLQVTRPLRVGLPLSRARHSASGRFVTLTDALQKLHVHDLHDDLRRIDTEATPLPCPSGTQAAFCANDTLLVHRQLSPSTAVQQLVAQDGKVVLGPRHTLPGGFLGKDVLHASTTLNAQFLVTCHASPSATHVFAQNNDGRDPWALHHQWDDANAGRSFALGSGQELVREESGALVSYGLPLHGQSPRRAIAGALRAIHPGTGLLALWRADTGCLMLTHGGVRPHFEDVNLSEWCTPSTARPSLNLVTGKVQFYKTTQATFSADGQSLALTEGPRVWVLRNLFADVTLRVPITKIPLNPRSTSTYPFNELQWPDNLFFDQQHRFVFGWRQTSNKTARRDYVRMYGLRRAPHCPSQKLLPTQAAPKNWAEQAALVAQPVFAPLAQAHSQAHPEPRSFWGRAQDFFMTLLHTVSRGIQSVVRYLFTPSKSAHMWPLQRFWN